LKPALCDLHVTQSGESLGLRSGRPWGRSSYVIQRLDLSPSMTI
jgi:hypothetical protein